jgi:hypothetical protein
MKITFLHKRDNGVAIEYGSDFWRTCLHDGIRYNEPENWTVAFEYDGVFASSRSVTVAYRSIDQVSGWYAFDWAIPDFPFDCITINDNKGRLIGKFTAPSGYEFKYDTNPKNYWIAFSYENFD